MTEYALSSCNTKRSNYEKKTIAIFAAYIFPHLGGIEIFLENFKKFFKNEYKLIFVTSNYKLEKNYEIKDDVTIIRFPVYRLFKNRYPIFKKNRLYKDLLKKLDLLNINLVIVNTRFHLTSHIGANYAQMNNIPVWLIEHGSDYITLDNYFIDFFANFYENFLTWVLKSKVNAFFGVSNQSNKWLSRLGINSNGVFYNAVSSDLYDKYKGYISNYNNKIVITFAGRLIKQKGIIILLEAFKKLNNPNTVLYVAGDGDLLQKLENAYIATNIVFLGKLSHEDTIKLFAKTDIFVNPPYHAEGGPITIIEAGLMKCAVLTTSQGLAKELISSDKYGLIIQSSVNDIVEKLNYLISNKSIIYIMKENLHKRVIESFTWEQTAKTIKLELQKLFNDTPGK